MCYDRGSCRRVDASGIACLITRAASIADIDTNKMLRYRDAYEAVLKAYVRSLAVRNQDRWLKIRDGFKNNRKVKLNFPELF